MKDFVKKHSTILFTCLSFLFLLFMMVNHIGHSALWYDEWVEYYYSQADIANGDLYRNIISTFQPPLYNLLMHYWLKVNQSILWFRLFNIIPGMISGLALSDTVRRLTKDRRLAALSVVLLAVSYQWVYYIQEAAEYALMLMFVFLTMHAYVIAGQKHSFLTTLYLALMSGGAAYSQYGCVFVVAPLLIMHMVRIFRAGDRKQVRNLLIIYGLSVVLLAAPLYVFYAKIQLGNHKIGGTDTLPVVWSPQDFLTKLGGLLVYIFVRSEPQETQVFMILGAVVLALTFLAMIIGRREKSIADLCLCLVIAYGLHYLLVVRHIYAMVHIGMSAGFYCRYSVFWICLFTVVIPLILHELLKGLGRNAAAAGLAVITLAAGVFSVPGIWRNWEKSHDNEIAWTWLEWKGYEQPTYLYGVAEYSFDYFIRDKGIEAPQVVYNCWEQIDAGKVPSQFWLWYADYGKDQAMSFDDMFEELDNQLSRRGYAANRVLDYQGMGKLIYYYRTGE
ncbi:MAG: glycosyltransferase family 39 protein [Solobacterium sp.]|nr:glycosyltransferase family 39 protein [Solobacterium sp.]